MSLMAVRPGQGVCQSWCRVTQLYVPGIKGEIVRSLTNHPGENVSPTVQSLTPDKPVTVNEVGSLGRRPREIAVRRQHVLWQRESPGLVARSTTSGDHRQGAVGEIEVRRSGIRPLLLPGGRGDIDVPWLAQGCRDLLARHPELDAVLQDGQLDVLGPGLAADLLTATLAHQLLPDGVKAPAEGYHSV